MYQVYWRINICQKPHINFPSPNLVKRQSHGTKFNENNDEGEEMLNE
jgi:hypothetical protein